ncbi:MAG: hypothetical protein CMI60_23405 [Parvibaculum sp.]|nr:hypothetical protein [Parvibaculum sp.]|tara:strand:- start:278 stop:832 length:555 start_codon:yes stop_codon:yes gene_type:complete
MALPLYLAKAGAAALIRQLMKKGLTRGEATKVVAQTKTPRQLQQVGVRKGIDKAGKKAGEAYQKLLAMDKKNRSGLVEESVASKLASKPAKKALNNSKKNNTKAAAAAAALASTPSSTGGKKTPTSKPEYSLPTVDVPSQITMSKGGAVKKMESGGAVGASRKSARKSIDGCAVRGKTRATRKV